MSTSTLTCHAARGKSPNLCSRLGLHVLGCEGHPFNPGYNATGWMGEEQLKEGRIESAKTLYARGVIDDAELERRIDIALHGGELEGDSAKP